MSKMIGNYGYRCSFGCCRTFLHSERVSEKRRLKRRERRLWRLEIR